MESQFGDLRYSAVVRANELEKRIAHLEHLVGWLTGLLIDLVAIAFGIASAIFVAGDYYRLSSVDVSIRPACAGMGYPPSAQKPPSITRMAAGVFGFLVFHSDAPGDNNDGQSEWAARARRSLKFCEMQIH